MNASGTEKIGKFVVEQWVVFSYGNAVVSWVVLKTFGGKRVTGLVPMGDTSVSFVSH